MFIKMSVLVDEHNPKIGKVKTIFIIENKNDVQFINNLVIIKMPRVEMCDHYSCN